MAGAGTGSVSLTTFGTAATENFDTLAATGASSTLPTGWYFDEANTGAAANGLYTAGTGTGTGGDVYSFGAAGSSDRAFGTLFSSSVTPTIGAQFTNDTGSSITSLAFAYAGEEWRLGTTGRADRLDFQISLDATSLTTGTWTNVDQLDFSTPDITTTGARDGNTLTTDLAYMYDVTSAIASGATFWIRWLDFNASGSDDGLGIDDFSITALQAAAPPAAGTLNIADASILEGNSNTQDIVFTVSRTDGSAGAVSATWTATLPGGSGGADSGDFASGASLTGTVNFADGATSAEIHFAVQGDTDFEPDENFTVALSNAQGGVALGDASASGVITNDDTMPTNGPANVFINEIHYDNSGTDAGEAIEIAGVAGTDLTGYSLILYNGSNTPNAAPTYGTVALTGVLDDEGQGYGALAFNFAANGLQNGIADGVALIAPDGSVVQLLSYEGTFTAAAGTPAAGLTSTDIGVSEDGTGGIADSLQLTGFGAAGDDFTWQPDSASSFGSLNVGQSIIPDNGTGLISVGDTRVTEGDTGTSNLVFTVHRAGGLGQSATVDYTVNLDGTATLDDLGAGATLSGTLTFAAGDRTATVTVPIQGDTIGEPNETLSLTLSNATGDVSIVDDSATGTIVNDDPVALSIGAIQGAGHQSAYVGQPVLTSGIVTAVDTNGFYLQDAVGDGNAATSDAIFVFTGSAPTVAVGNGVSLSGTVAEFAGDAAGLTVTEITAPTVTVTSAVNDLPDAVLIGIDGILPPTEVIDDDSFAVFDPQNDGIDFWESLEGMRVTIETPQAVSLTNSFGETDVVASFGEGATGINDRGGITLSPGDYNPEKIQIDDDSGIFSGFTPDYSIGDQLSNVTGIVNYSFDNYEVLVTDAVTVTKDVTLTQEVTMLGGDANHLSIATYNLENLDVTDNKFDVLAGNIVYNLNAPDIVAVQEIQDADGAGTGSDLSGTVTAQGLIDQIFAQSGKHYAYVEIAPTTPNSTGGEPNGNIRNGFLYNIDRVDYVEGSAELVPGAAYNGTRSPLVAQFNFAGQTVTAIDVHFTSRGGSDPLWGDSQPPNNAGDAARTAQAAGVQTYIESHLADDPSLNIALLGDFNGFYYEDAQTQLTDPAQGGVLTNLNFLLPEEERYSYLFEGNAQQIDNILVTGGLVGAAQYDSVHLNSQFGGSRPTDHDPQLAVLAIGSAAVAQDDMFATDEATLVAGDLFADNGAGADSNVDSALTVAAVNGVDTNVDNQIALASGALLKVNADGTFAYDPGGAFDTLTGVTGATNSSGTDGFTYTLAGGGTATATITIAGLGNDPAYGTAGDDVMVGTSGDDRIFGYGGADTIDGGGGDDRIFIGSTPNRIVGGAGTDTLFLLAGGSAMIGNAQISGIEAVQVYDGSSLDLTGVGAGIATIRSRSLSGGGATIHGSNAGDVIFGGAGADTLDGGVGDDRINVYATPASIAGGAGVDSLYLHDAVSATFTDATLTGVARVFVYDGGSVDVSQVTAGFDVLRSLSTATGGATIVAGNRADVVFGGLGADTLSGGGGDDRIGVSAQPAYVDGGAGTGDILLLGGGASYVFDDTSLTGVERVFVRGDTSVDLSAVHADLSINTIGDAGTQSAVVGTAGANRIVGGASDDTLDGGGGADVLRGGAGADTFAFSSLADTVGTDGAIDRVFDFSRTQGDTIALSAIDADPARAGQQTFTFIGTDAFGTGGTDYQVRVTGSQNGNSYIQFDTDHDGRADYTIFVHSDAPLTNADIVV